MSDATPVFSDAFGQALEFTVRIHGAQRRKAGSDDHNGPSYLGHLLGVAALVIEDGGSEAEVIAGLLHDSIEDTDTTAEDLETQFGSAVTAMVVGCTDTQEDPKPPWYQRKKRYLDHLPSATPSVLRVSNADKLYNARTILADLRHLGEDLWQRFNPTKDDILWYYDELSKTFTRHNPGYLAEELQRTVTTIGSIADYRLSHGG